jgi:hypothetical protein
MARTTLAERKQKVLDELKRAQDELKEIERKEKEAQRAAHKRRVEIVGKAIVGLEDGDRENAQEVKLYCSVMELLDRTIENEDDRELFSLDDEAHRKELGLKPRTAQPERPAA